MSAEARFWTMAATGVALGAALLWLTGCTTILVSAPPCPIPSEQAEAQLGAIMGLAAAGGVPTDALDRYLGEQERYCTAIDTGTATEACDGSRLGCWWAGLWR